MLADLAAQVCEEARVAVAVGRDLGAQRGHPALDDVVEAIDEPDEDPPALGADLLVDGDVLDDAAHTFTPPATACNMLPDVATSNRRGRTAARARRRFQAAERIDMSALAEELGVNRVTLYRWVGSRDRLLVEVIWSLGRRHAGAHRRPTSGDRAPSGSSRSSRASSTT